MKKFNMRIALEFKMYEHKRARPWLARILGPDKQYRFQREFLDAEIVEGKAPGPVFTYYVEDDGLYQWREARSWKNDDGGFFVVEDGEQRDVTEHEATMMARTLEEG